MANIPDLLSSLLLIGVNILEEKPLLRQGIAPYYKLLGLLFDYIGECDSDREVELHAGIACDGESLRGGFLDSGLGHFV